MKGHSIRVQVVFNNIFTEALVSTVDLVADIPLNAVAVRGLIEKRLTDLLAYNSDEGLEKLYNGEGEGVLKGVDRSTAV